MRTINDLALSYPDFKEFDIIQPYETNQNNEEIVIKINEILSYFNPILSENGAINIKMPLVDGIDEPDVYNSFISVSNYLKKLDSDIATHKGSKDHDGRYYTKEELSPYLRGGDTIIHEETFIITSEVNGEGTFTYSNGDENFVGEVTEDGYYVFTLLKGTYQRGMNRVEALIDDTLRRSVVSGGIVEISENKVALTETEEVGTEITFKYYERIGVAVEYNINLSETKPVRGSGNTMWFEKIGEVSQRDFKLEEN